VSDRLLCSLREKSQNGWDAAIEGYRDSWRASEKTSISVISSSSMPQAIKYSRLGTNRGKLLVNHGGPGGRVNEIWRYFVNADHGDLLLPAQSQIDSDDDFVVDTDTILTNTETLQRTCFGEPAVIAGSSWGGTVSLAYATKYPHAAAALVISCPLIPTEKSLDFMVSSEGGFSGNLRLREMFIDPIRHEPHATARQIFSAYHSVLDRAAPDSYVIRAFSALLYASSGDFSTGLYESDIPIDGMTRRHATMLAYFAMQPRPFFIDIGQVYRGLQELRRQKCSVFIVRSTDDRSSHPDDMQKIIDLSGARAVWAVGGHSSKSSKAAVARILRDLKI
jgi:pimeloyl-ACP methyl ester carboxylesterase